jgi:predicted phosphodiesterase
MIPRPVLNCGHTHEPLHVVQEVKLAVNPGLVVGLLYGEITIGRWN